MARFDALAICSSSRLIDGNLLSGLAVPKRRKNVWADAATNMLPDLMGFSIAGMAIFLAFSNANTMKAITEDGEPQSYFVGTVANFFHFILVQTIALILGFLGLHFVWDPLSAFGVFFLLYALLVSPAMAMQLFQTARVINAAESIRPKRTAFKPHTRR